MFDVNFHGEDHAISGSFGQAQFVGLIVTCDSKISRFL